MSHSPKGITIYAPESNYDSETIRRLLEKFLSNQDQNQVKVNLRTPSKSQFDNLMKKDKKKPWMATHFPPVTLSKTSSLPKPDEVFFCPHPITVPPNFSLTKGVSTCLRPFQWSLAGKIEW